MHWRVKGRRGLVCRKGESGTRHRAQAQSPAACKRAGGHFARSSLVCRLSQTAALRRCSCRLPDSSPGTRSRNLRMDRQTSGDGEGKGSDCRRHRQSAPVRGGANSSVQARWRIQETASVRNRINRGWRLWIHDH